MHDVLRLTVTIMSTSGRQQAKDGRPSYSGVSCLIPGPYVRLDKKHTSRESRLIVDPKQSGDPSNGVSGAWRGVN